MLNRRLLLFGSCLMLTVASAALCFSGPSAVSASGGESCSGSTCWVLDTTLADFAQGNFYSTGLRNLVDGEVQLLPIGITSQWVTDTKKLPAARAELAAVIYRDKIYAIGGKDTVARSEIFSATTLITGPISASGWTTSTTLPRPRTGAAAVISTTQTGAFIFVIAGGDEAGNNTSTVYSHFIDASGNFSGDWITGTIDMSYLFFGNGLIYAQAVAHNGYLYIIGGLEDGAPQTVHNEISRAPINSNGTLGAWTLDQSLPTPLSSQAVAVWPSGGITDSLYVMGGLSTTAQSGQPEVYISSFNSTGSNGALQPFTNSSFSLPEGYFGLGGVQGNGEIFATAGKAGVSGIVSGTVLSTLINPNGVLPDNWATSFPLPKGRFNHATVINSGGEVYVIGGLAPQSDGGQPTDTVFHGGTSGAGQSYAAHGIFTSRIIDLGTLHPLSSLIANTTFTVTGPTLSLEYRVAQSIGNLLASPWTALGNAPLGSNISTTFTLSDKPNASLVQYRAIYTNTSPFTSSPLLNAFQIVYPSSPTPFPDLVAYGIQAPVVSGIQTTQTITVYVRNAGNLPFRPAEVPTQTVLSPAAASKLPLPQWKDSSQPKSPIAAQTTYTSYINTTHYFFWVEVYPDQPRPNGVTDHGNCQRSSGGIIAGDNIGYVLTGSLPIGSQVAVPVHCYLNPGSHTYYAQVDTCDDSTGQFCSLTYGYILEGRETNNIFGPVSSGQTKFLTIRYLPLILR